jgi:hypothetical protein
MADELNNHGSKGLCTLTSRLHKNLPGLHKLLSGLHKIPDGQDGRRASGNRAGLHVAAMAAGVKGRSNGRLDENNALIVAIVTQGG